MVVAFTITEIKYFMSSLFCDVVLPTFYLYLWYYFLIWLRYWFCFRHSDKSVYCSLYIQFYKLLLLWFHVDFFLKLLFYYNAVEYRHKYHNTQHISMRKNSCFIVYMTASPEELPSITLGLGVSVQPAKPTSPIWFLYQELPKVYVYSAHKIFTTFVLLFLIEYLISRSWLCLRCMCSVHC